MMRSREFSKTIATGEAEQLWDLYGFSKPDELVLEDLAFARHVLVTEGPLDRMEARLVCREGRGLIRVKHDIPELGRKRFAIAHELGHWELHKSIMQVFVCTSKDMIVAYKTSDTEVEANFFASGLLMPTRLFSQQSSDMVLSVKTISELASYFSTSFTSTAIRYVDLSSEACAVVVSSAGRIQWWRGSRDFENQFWLDARSQLSLRTAAGSILKGGQRPTGPEEVDISDWSERGADRDPGVFIEDCLVMDRYGQVLSLLRLP